MRLHGTVFFQSRGDGGREGGYCARKAYYTLLGVLAFYFPQRGAKVKHICKTLPQTSCVSETLYAKEERLAAFIRMHLRHSLRKKGVVLGGSRHLAPSSLLTGPLQCTNTTLPLEGHWYGNRGQWGL